MESYITADESFFLKEWDYECEFRSLYDEFFMEASLEKGVLWEGAWEISAFLLSSS